MPAQFRNTTSNDIWQDQVAIHVGYTVTALLILQFLGYCIYALSSRPDFKELKRPFNTLMLFGTISGVLGAYGFVASIQVSHYRDIAKLEHLFEGFGIAGVELMYILVSWIRASHIMKRHNPKSFRFMALVVKLSPVIFLLPCLAKIMEDYGPEKWSGVAKKVAMGLNFFSGFIAILCDTVFLHCFTKFLFKTMKDLTDFIGLDFKLICEHGVVCSLCIYVALVLFIISAVIGDDHPYLNFVVGLCYIAMMLSLTSLLAMKIRLNWHREREGSNGMSEPANASNSKTAESAALSRKKSGVSAGGGGGGGVSIPTPTMPTLPSTKSGFEKTPHFDEDFKANRISILAGGKLQSLRDSTTTTIQPNENNV
ncbi:hypothetical protein BDR26DRAFT_936173 [Obelidium mucronatum]|nr:hypothetical protein BDR26DRAFT_936173 [Obelidium mucronatum]